MFRAECRFIFFLRLSGALFRFFLPLELGRFFLKRDGLLELPPVIDAVRVDVTGTGFVGFDLRPAVAQFLDDDQGAFLIVREYVVIVGHVRRGADPEVILLDEAPDDADFLLLRFGFLADKEKLGFDVALDVAGSHEEPFAVLSVHLVQDLGRTVVEDLADDRVRSRRAGTDVDVVRNDRESGQTDLRRRSRLRGRFRGRRGRRVRRRFRNGSADTRERRSFL